MFKKLLLSFLASLVLLVTISTPYAKAQGQWYDQSFGEWYTKVYNTDISPPGQIFGERYTAAQVQWILYSFLSFHLNFFPGAQVMNAFFSRDISEFLNVLEGVFSYNPGEGPYYTKKENKSLLSLVFEERSFSGIGYIKEKARDFHIIPEAKAQEGVGFGALNPVRDLWKGARDVSYAFFTFIIIFFAFAIMFRMRLFSPQAAVTVQSAIPRVAIALVLVTFSYAIAGFLVDLVYVAIGIIAIIVNLGLPGNTLDTVANAYNFMVGRLEIGIGCPSSPLCLTTGVPLGILLYLVQYIVLFIIGFLISLLAFGFESLLNFVLGIVLGLLGIIAIVIIIFILVILYFRVMWMLLKALAFTYLLTIIAPLQIAFGAVTNSGGFKSWLKNMIANLAIFPATGGLLYISFIFLFRAMWEGLRSLGNTTLCESLLSAIFNIFGWEWLGCDQGLDSGWVPPLLGGDTSITPLILLMTSLVILLLIPKVGDIIKSAMSGRPFGYGAALGEVAGGPALVGAGWLSSHEQQRWQGIQASGVPPTVPQRIHHGAAQVVRTISGGKIK